MRKTLRYRAVIQAGGKGTRMSEITDDRIPKPMLQIAGKPMILWQMEHIARYGIKDFVIITGHLGEVIEDYPEDFPFPSCLVFGHATNGSVIHVVVGYDMEYLYIVTAYIPDTTKFEEDLKTRKER